MYWNGGAYADIGPRVTQKSGFTAPGPYDIENVAINSYALYTNRPPAGALRGFGIPQLVWAYESHTDLIAREMGIDPLEFRRKNILRDGRPQATGTKMQRRGDRPGARENRRTHELERALRPRQGSSPPRPRHRGRIQGFDLSHHLGRHREVDADGSVCLTMGTVDMGQGSDTAMAQIVAETMNIRTEDISVVHPDTDVAPYDMATLGSRSTFHMGNAVKLAAEHARAKLAALGRAKSSCPAGTN